MRERINNQREIIEKEREEQKTGERERKVKK
jgi:hypothetical protein